jgi:dUTP pyrophosphatase
MGKEVEVLIEVCREGVELPEYAHFGDAGMDLRAAEDIDIHPGETVAVPTGLKVAIPVGYEIQVRPRSGISLKTPLRLPNSPGTIDAGYRDEMHVIMYNSSRGGEEIYSISEKGNKEGIYRIKKGERIAQIVLKEVPIVKWKKVTDVSLEGSNRGGGFGSSGIK